MNTKRIIALLICAIMVLSMIPVAAFTAGAAEVDGDWVTYRFANEYPDEDEEEDPDAEPTVYKPEAGYHYTEEGFSTIAPSYKDTTPSMTVITKEKQAVKDGIYLQFRIDDYSYDGGTGADQWIAPSLSTEPKVAPGSPNYGGGWLSLLRGNGQGDTCTYVPCTTDPKTEDFGGVFNQGTPLSNMPVVRDEEGREIYTLEVTYENDAYSIKINGMDQTCAYDAMLKKLDPDGMFYVGINIQSTVKDGTASLTILKYGTSEADATKPVGADEKEPEENEMTIADIADPNTIEANKPAILWAPDTYNLKGGNNVAFTTLGDNTWRANASDAVVFWQFTPKRSWSYSGEDFPVFGIMFRNVWFTDGTLWYAAGEVMSSKDGCNYPISINEGEFYGEEEDYVFIPWDMTDLWEGRINSIRLDFNIADEANREFDVCFAGMFRSEDEAYAYAESYLKEIGVLSEDYTKAPETTAAPKTEAPETDPVDVDTNATVDTGASAGNSETTGSTDEGGCASVIGFGAVAVMAAAAAVVALKKKD